MKFIDEHLTVADSTKRCGGKRIDDRSWLASSIGVKRCKVVGYVGQQTSRDRYRQRLGESLASKHRVYECSASSPVAVREWVDSLD